MCVRQTQRSEWRHQLFLSPRIIPITDLGFQKSDLGQNKKTNLSDNVNVQVLLTLLLDILVVLKDEMKRRDERMFVLPLTHYMIQQYEGLEFSHAALTNPVAQLTVNLQTLSDWKMK